MPWAGKVYDLMEVFRFAMNLHHLLLQALMTWTKEYGWQLNRYGKFYVAPERAPSNGGLATFMGRFPKYDLVPMTREILTQGPLDWRALLSKNFQVFHIAKVEKKYPEKWSWCTREIFLVLFKNERKFCNFWSLQQLEEVGEFNTDCAAFTFF